tara:strand:- start:873 stop:992 length:120 start_codon:yes stop_codon:yes gene_type:complete
MDNAYGAVKQDIEIKKAETAIFKQLDIDIIKAYDIKLFI